MRYWITLDDLDESAARELYEKIEPANANVTVLLERVDIYGDAPETDVQKIIYLCAKTGAKMSTDFS